MQKQMVLIAVAMVSLSVAPRLGTAQMSSQAPTLGQQNPSSTLPSRSRSTLPTLEGRSEDAKDDPTAAVREAQRTRSFATERQKKMLQDTDKLLALATELKQQMDKSNKNEMSLDVIKKADEIERLAHDVKIRMKG